MNTPEHELTNNHIWRGQETTKYGHKRREHMTHTTEPWHNSPLPEGVCHAVTVPLGRGGGRSGGPSGQTRKGPQDGDLQSGTDNGGHGRCKEFRRPWWCRELRRPWQVVFHGRGLFPRPGHSSRNPSTPKKKFPAEVRGYQEPSGARQTGQYMTWQENPPGPDEQDRTFHRNQKPSWAGLEAEASSGHDEESGALTGSLSNRFHINDREAGGWNGLLRPQNKESPAPDESPRTRPTRLD